MQMLIADSGGTKTDWVYVDSFSTRFFSGEGLHPAYNSEDQILSFIESAVKMKPSEVDKIFFYGAGCHGDLPAGKIRKVLMQSLPGCEIEIFDDLTGAARAHLQKDDGIIAALGTGSVCGRYINGQITQRSAALGYAIGDEGSAVDLGRSAIRSFFRKTMDSETERLTTERLGEHDYSAWMNRIYGSGKPNRELARIAGELFSGELTDQLRTIVTHCFEQFLNSQFASLSPVMDENIVFIGSVSAAHSALLLTLLEKQGFMNCSVSSGVIKGLAQYHTN